jgi:FkbH-like protein
MATARATPAVNEGAAAARKLLEAVPLGDLAAAVKAVDAVEAAGLMSEAPVRITVLRNFTLETIEPFLRLHVFRSALMPVVRFGGYDTVQQDVLGPDSPLAAEPPPDLVVLALMLDRLDPAHQRPDWSADVAIAKLTGLFEALEEATDALIAVNTLIPPWHDPHGIGARPATGDLATEIARLNRFITEQVRVRGRRFFLVDWERLLRLLGRDAAIDDRYWYLSRAPFKPAFLDLYAREIAKLVRALKGKAKKCLVLDCDNTLWGGVIGEDLLAGIELDPNEHPGRIYHDFQATVLRLAARGVMIALCSRNNEADVLEVLDEHPHCLIGRKHLVGWRIDWRDKLSNITALAEELNIGLDSMVFVDDDAAECQLVRDLLPEVTVLQVPRKLYLYPELLLRDGLFDTLAVSEEDQRRHRLYQEERSRCQEAARFADLDDYLASMEMVVLIRQAPPEAVPRTAQLTQKTNQFNLTTRRYGEADIAHFCASGDHVVFNLSLTDRFGDAGLTGVCIAVRDGDTVTIDSLLLSCRILGRKVELAFVNHFLQDLIRRWRPKLLKASYLPTAKNSQVAEFWERFGFTAEPSTDGAKHYTLAPRAVRFQTVPFIRVETG